VLSNTICLNQRPAFSYRQKNFIALSSKIMERMARTKDHGNGIIEFIVDGIIVNKPDEWISLFPGAGQTTAIIRRENIHPDFYDLKTGFAGALLQKISTYSKRLAITGDFSGISSGAFNDFRYESNKTGQVVLVNTVEDALAIFAKQAGTPHFSGGSGAP
jgi:hypothetical protein